MRFYICTLLNAPKVFLFYAIVEQSLHRQPKCTYHCLMGETYCVDKPRMQGKTRSGRSSSSVVEKTIFKSRGSSLQSPGHEALATHKPVPLPRVAKMHIPGQSMTDRFNEALLELDHTRNEPLRIRKQVFANLRNMLETRNHPECPASDNLALQELMNLRDSYLNVWVEQWSFYFQIPYFWNTETYESVWEMPDPHATGSTPES